MTNQTIIPAVSKREKFFEALITEYNELLSVGYNMLIAQYSVAGGLLILGTLVYSTNLNKYTEVLVFFPFFLIIIYCCILYNYCEILSMGGYRQALGDILNKEFKTGVLNWESFTKRNFHQSNRMTVIISTICVSFLLFAEFNSVYHAQFVKPTVPFLGFLNFPLIRKFTIGMSCLAISYIIIWIIFIIEILKSYNLFEISYNSAYHSHYDIQTKR